MARDNPEKLLSDPQQLNSYSYARNNPLRYVDPKGESIADILVGVANAYASNNAFGVGRISSDHYSGNQHDYLYGQTLGDLASALIGLAQAIIGAGIGAGGAAVTVGSGGTLAVVGAPIAIEGAVIATHGTATAGISVYHFAEDVGGWSRGGSEFSGEDLCVRGGSCSTGSFGGGKGVDTGSDGSLSGISVAAKPGASFDELAKSLSRYKKIGVSTIGKIRAAGGQIIYDGEFHSTLSGLIDFQAVKIFNPNVIRNPFFRKGY